MTGTDLFPGSGVQGPNSGTTTFIGFLGRRARTGSWEELSNGTFREATRAAQELRWHDAADLVDVSLLEAEELREVYEEWPQAIISWVRGQGALEFDIEREQGRLHQQLGERAMRGIEAAWPKYDDSVRRALAACRNADSETTALIEEARSTWLAMHDDAVDRVSGLIDIAVRLLGEESLVLLWDHLMSDWYEVHARRYSLEHQPWETSAHQLMVSIVDGFHAHLAGANRQGDIEVIHEEDRIGFRFAPCGSGGRAVDATITNGQPRSGHPFDFAVTTKPHDWAWNKTGVCSYCVHCCLLNEVMPIDRLGYPTRVIDPPVWNHGDGPTACTWWVYRHPSLIPDEIYTRVGRTPDRRPSIPTSTA